MNIKERNIFFYSAACQYLNRIKPDGVDLEKYLTSEFRENQSIEDIYRQFIGSAQNYQSMPNVIKFWKREKQIAHILGGYNLNIIAEMDETKLYHRFREEFAVTTEDSRYNSWYKWTCSVIDSAKYLQGFTDAYEFDKYVRSFDDPSLSPLELPRRIQSQIRGIGFALACDLLKELGYTGYPKPDVHLIEVFHGLGLSDEDQFSTFEAIVRMANDCKSVYGNATPYRVDKVFWLICSGYFYDETPPIKIKSHKKELIRYLLEMEKEKDKDGPVQSVLKAETLDRIRHLSAEQGLQAIHTPENLAKTIVIEAAELLGCYQWGKEADLDHVKEELANVIIYCQNMVDALGLDVDVMINEKIDKISKT